MARNSVRLFSLKNTKSFKTKTRQEERKKKKKKASKSLLLVSGTTMWNVIGFILLYGF